MIGTPGREQAFDNRAANLANFSNRAAKTALMVAAGSSGGNKKLTEALLASSGQVSVYFYILNFKITRFFFYSLLFNFIQFSKSKHLIIILMIYIFIFFRWKA